MARRKQKKTRGNPSGAARLLLVAFLLLLVVAGGAVWLVYTPYGPHREIFVDIAPGSSAVHIGRQLEEAGVIRSRFGFYLVRWLSRGKLLAGEYRFDHPATVDEVYTRIVRGDVYTVAVVIPEGATVFDIGARIQQAGLGTKQQFVREQARLVGLIADLDPGAKSLEGYLFPDTYRFTRKATTAQIAAAMVHQFRLAAAQLGLKENVHAVVTMASLVERETAVNADRPLVASVFQNRLDRKMPLMTDPSVIYGLELAGEWRGAIYQSDLKRNTPYNTYLHAGLPPGPIANPGIRSLRAAMHPARTDYLYFVAADTNPQGQSHFSATLEEHARAVAGYRSAVKKAGAR